MRTLCVVCGLLLLIGGAGCDPVARQEVARAHQLIDDNIRLDTQQNQSILANQRALRALGAGGSGSGPIRTDDSSAPSGQVATQPAVMITPSGGAQAPAAPGAAAMPPSDAQYVTGHLVQTYRWPDGTIVNSYQPVGAPMLLPAACQTSSPPPSQAPSTGYDYDESREELLRAIIGEELDKRLEGLKKSAEPAEEPKEEPAAEPEPSEGPDEPKAEPEPTAQILALQRDIVQEVTQDIEASIRHGVLEPPRPVRRSVPTRYARYTPRRSYYYTWRYSGGRLYFRWWWG